MVDFDAWNDAFRGEKIDEVLAIVGRLVGGLVEENDTIDVVCEIWGGEEDIAVVAAVVVGVGNV